MIIIESTCLADRSSLVTIIITRKRSYHDVLSLSYKFFLQGKEIRRKKRELLLCSQEMRLSYEHYNGGGISELGQYRIHRRS